MAYIHVHKTNCYILEMVQYRHVLAMEYYYGLPNSSPADDLE